MMLVLCLSKCPPSLRGDLTKWLQEIDTGVYVGQVSARVRDELWERVKANAKDGRATMVFHAGNEQHMAFRVHNTDWIPIDFDGMKLMLRPHANLARPSPAPKAGFSAASSMNRAKKHARRGKARVAQPDRYAVVDVETTGLSIREDRIIELGAIKVENGEIVARFERLVRDAKAIPQPIVRLTGISDDLLARDGVEEGQALLSLIEFIEDLPLVMHNMAFDMGFLRQACKRCGLPPPANAGIDTLNLAKRLLDDVDDLKLGTLAKHFDICISDAHRSLGDCCTTKLVYDKLMKML